MNKKNKFNDITNPKKEKLSYKPQFIKKQAIENKNFDNLIDEVTYKNIKTNALFEIVKASLHFYIIHENYVFEQLNINHTNIEKYIIKNTKKIIEINFKKGLMFTIDNNYKVLVTYRKNKLLPNSSKIFKILNNLNFK